ncbi:MAG: hypothetical protein AVDCRST_MAG48-3029, partial [uncultured Friedmanniella sp.]
CRSSPRPSSSPTRARCAPCTTSASRPTRSPRPTAACRPTSRSTPATTSPEVGTLFELDDQAINAVEPDLVIVGSRSGTPEVVEELTTITPAVVDLSARAETPAALVPAVEQRVTQIGQIFGVEEQAAAQMTEVRSAIADAKAEAEGADLSAMFVQVSGGKASAYGPTSRFGAIYSDFGFAETGAPVDEEGSHGEEIGAEFFARYNPGVIFVLDRGKAIGQAEQPALEVCRTTSSTGPTRRRTTSSSRWTASPGTSPAPPRARCARWWPTWPGPS